jgi:hypothetical protein
MPATQTIDKETLCQKILHMSDIAAKQAVDSVGCPESHEPNEETAAVLRDIDARRNMVGPFNTFEEMLRDFGIDVDI